jgi:hypothetical protein
MEYVSKYVRNEWSTFINKLNNKMKVRGGDDKTTVTSKYIYIFPPIWFKILPRQSKLNTKLTKQRYDHNNLSHDAPFLPE